MARYFVVRVAVNEDGPDPKVVVDTESDADLIPVLRQMLPILQAGATNVRHIIAQEVTNG